MLSTDIDHVLSLSAATHRFEQLGRCALGDTWQDTSGLFELRQNRIERFVGVKLLQISHDFDEFGLVLHTLIIGLLGLKVNHSKG